MKKILMLLAVCFCIYLPPVFAETYQNRDYNFQMEIPDEWGIEELALSKVDEEGNLVLRRGLKPKPNQLTSFLAFELKAMPDTHLVSGATLANATVKRKKELLDDCIQAIKEKYPTSHITYSDFVQIGNHHIGIIKIKYTNSQINQTFILVAFNRTYYYIESVYNDPTGQYEQQFFDMLKTLRPIVGNNDSDEWQEDVKYMRDVAEREAINKYTKDEIKVEVKDGQRDAHRDNDLDGVSDSW